MCFKTLKIIKAAAMFAAGVLIGTTLSATALAQGLPLSGTATASTQAAASRSAAMANDGNFSTRWEASNSSPGNWLRISFVEPKLVQSLVLHEYGNRITQHRVEYLNGSVWTSLGSGTGVGSSLTYTFAPVTTSAVRVLILHASAQPSITEFGVFGTEELGFYPGCKMPTATQTIQLASTVTVGPGEQFDGGNARYNLTSSSDVSVPLFSVAEGGSVRNVIIGPLAADGIHCLGNCTLNNVWWEDVGEDAATALGGAGTVMTVDCGAAYKSVDRMFQHNGLGEVRISRFYGAGTGKFYRSCGNCTFSGPRRASINSVITRNLSNTAGINTNFGDVVTIRSLTLDNTNSTPTNICQVYRGVPKGAGTAMLLGSEFNTPNCNVSPADVTLKGPSQVAPATCTGSCPL